MNSILFYVIFIVLLVIMLILPYFSQKRKNQEYNNMLLSLKVGDLVKTAGGIIGKITKITDKGDFKTVILETGSKEKSTIELDMSMIYCILKSTKVASPKQEEKADEDFQDDVTEQKVNEETSSESETKEERLKPKTSKIKYQKSKK